MDTLDQVLTQELDTLAGRDLLRRERVRSLPRGVTSRAEGQAPKIFGSNDYLGLAEHPEVVEAARRACETWGAGSTGSRLTSGTLELHHELEGRLAALKGTEAALLFGSGYLAGVGVIPALVGRGDLILSDELNHASLIDGCRLSRAEVRVYRHGDVAHAQSLLADGERFRRRLLVTDGVFSMDGDVAPLPELCGLCETTGAWLMVDDAHGTGVLGASGAGTVEHLGVAGRVVVQMGTLGKALGSEGAFIAGSRVLIDYLRNRARSFIFSTAPAPASIGAALASVEIVRREPERRERLAHLARTVRESLQKLGLAVPTGVTPIIPIVAGEAGTAMDWMRQLEAEGVWAPAIRPPTVPEGTARLRLSMTASHGEEDIALALSAFARLRPAEAGAFKR